MVAIEPRANPNAARVEPLRRISASLSNAASASRQGRRPDLDLGALDRLLGDGLEVLTRERRIELVQSLALRADRAADHLLPGVHLVGEQARDRETVLGVGLVTDRPEGRPRGRGFEALHKYRLPHGEAVAIDIALTCAIGSELGLLQAADRDRVIGLLVSLGLPVTSSRLDPASSARALDESLAHRGGAVSLVVPTGIGRARFLSSRERPPSSALQAAMVLVGRHRPFRGRRPGSMECLAFDVGGTWLRAAVCEADHRPCSDLEVAAHRVCEPCPAPPAPRFSNACWPR
jgi:hypothetical protein